MEEYPELSKDFLLICYRQGLDGMVGLDKVFNQKHLTAVNSMTVVSMIYFCDITKAVKIFWQVDDLLQFQKSILKRFIEELMGKIIKEFVCENGDCLNKKNKGFTSVRFYHGERDHWFILQYILLLRNF